MYSKNSSKNLFPFNSKILLYILDGSCQERQKKSKQKRRTDEEQAQIDQHRSNKGAMIGQWSVKKMQVAYDE